ncbi:MAG: hypothetical protein WBL85_05530 [Sedimentisphaerales bacterium]
MARLLQILFVCSVVMLAAGCDNAQKKPNTEGIKIGDIAPTGKRAQPQHLRTTNIEIISYELPADNITSMEGVWQMLKPGTLRYNDLDGFAANGLRAAMGNFAAFNKVTKILKNANANNLPKNSLLLSDNQPEMINITRISHKTISFIGRQGVVKNADVGPGIVGLQVLSRQIISDSALPGTNKPPESNVEVQANRPQLANIQITPVIFSSTEGAAPALAERIRENDLRIYSAGFSAMMKPGDFVLLSPREYNPDETTASGRFFTQSGPKPIITVYLLVCVSIF